MIRYCVSCILPSTKPDLAFSDDGVCQACINFSNREEIDWNARQEEFISILEKSKSLKSGAWDCIVPVSGGKDSTYQVLKIKELGFNPLAVTARTCDLTPIGRENLDSLRHLGVDHIELSPNPLVRSTLNRIGLERVGDISWPEHVGIFTLPVRASVMVDVPLIIWGENSQNEYGGPAALADNKVLDRRWLEEFGGLLGLRVSDLETTHNLSREDLFLYTYPEDHDLQRVGTRGLFLGHFFPWDGLSNALVSQLHGFQVWNTVVEGSAAGYENLDNYQTAIHDYFKFLKFGFAKASDILSMHIRRGRVSRQQAIDVVQDLEGKFPWKYLDRALESILEPLQISIERFVDVCDEFTNVELFETGVDGELLRDTKGNLRKINYDNP